MADALATMIETYHELNASVIDILSEEPSPLEFMRYAAKNRPFVVRRGAADWKAVTVWNSEYLINSIGDEQVKIAVTPQGNADSVVSEDGKLIFVKPYETQETFKDFLRDVRIQEETHEDGDVNAHNARTTHAALNGVVKYAQTQNDNLRNEYAILFADVPKDIAFARIALQQEADAINLWLGNSNSVTALHKDNYENIYVQVTGRKHFVLLPPVEMPCVNEQDLPNATYTLGSRDDTQKSHEDLVVTADEPPDQIPVATWDPEEPHVRPTRYSHLSKPMKVTLGPGDMLYLPSMWYHRVSQSCDDEGFVCAVNYWYDMDFSGGFWTANNFVRDVTKSVASERVD